MNEHGYLMSHHYVARYGENPARQGCRWNDKENDDLRKSLADNVPIDEIATHHQRTASAIGMHMIWEKLW